MGIGHRVFNKTKQNSFFNSDRRSRFSHGGELRKKQIGRGHRPLSTKNPIHAVFKVERLRLRHRSLRSPNNFSLVLNTIKKYSKYFSVKVEQLSVQNDHIHLLIRTSKRSQFHHFFRVVPGQIAQCFEKENLLARRLNRSASSMTDTPEKDDRKSKSIWKHRPFTRIVVGLKGYKIIRNYIQLNEKEALGEIRYQKNRLRGLSLADWQILWK